MIKREQIFQVKDFGKIVACIWQSGHTIAIASILLKVLQSALPISMLC